MHEMVLRKRALQKIVAFMEQQNFGYLVNKVPF